MSSTSPRLCRTSRRWPCASSGHHYSPPARELRGLSRWRQRRGQRPHGRGLKNPNRLYTCQIKPTAKPQRLSRPTFSTASVTDRLCTGFLWPSIGVRTSPDSGHEIRPSVQCRLVPTTALSMRNKLCEQKAWNSLNQRISLCDEERRHFETDLWFVS